MSATFVTTSALVTLFGLLALRPPRPRHSSPWNLSFALGHLINEQPFLAFYWLAAGTLPTLVGTTAWTPGWWIATGVVAVPAAVLTALAVRARTARPVLDAALRDAIGPGQPRHRRFRPPLVRILFLPFLSFRPDVRRVRNIRYGDAGRGQLLDVYVGRSAPEGAPVLIYLHGGAFRTGGKMLGARALLHRMAAEGWVCVSADYRLRRHARYADQLLDVKRVIHWVRTHGAAYGADASTLLLAGGSSGAHLAATAALTANDPQLQPGLPDADTSVDAVVAFYGYYGTADDDGRVTASPLAHLHADAPPFLIVHGALDTLVLAEDARHFANELGRHSAQPVAYAELPGTQHNFDMFQSLRTHYVVEAVERFASWTRSGKQEPARE
ncbi:alpha/beta hydrolase [Streptomyces sp. NPDC056194]|uniref:alpha/beta hydrolase n=1 Tax=unclassified Streptomyces TaxID=2593676 RepID=UPI0035E22689